MKENRKTIADVICPKCKSGNWYSYSTDGIYFDADGTGHYIFDIRCMACQKDSRIICNFEYNLTSGIECDHPTEKGGAEE